MKGERDAKTRKREKKSKVRKPQYKIQRAATGGHSSQALRFPYFYAQVQSPGGRNGHP